MEQKQIMKLKRLLGQLENRFKSHSEYFSCIEFRFHSSDIVTETGYYKDINGAPTVLYKNEHIPLFIEDLMDMISMEAQHFEALDLYYRETDTTIYLQANEEDVVHIYLDDES